MMSSSSFLGERGFPQADATLSPWQRHALVFGGGSLLALLFFYPLQTLLTLNIVFTVFFLISTLYRSILADVSLRRNQAMEITAAELIPPPGGWPGYVIQVPLYHEHRVLPQLVEGLKNLDYPPDRLQIQLLIEEDDQETLMAARALELSAPFHIVLIPASQPRTKPKACNVGLAAAEGKYLVIYDAEDRPEPDQLKKAVIAYSKCEENVACIQAKLNFYNTEQNLITRCFTAEYSMWFDLLLPGLDRLNAPIPLGGTSNHFRLAILRQLQGWDEYNVTEDCDLGVRLFLAGWQTRILESTTWEEACPRTLPWIRQRSRWAKGYIQTYLVHTRNLFSLTRILGWRNSLHFHLLIGGSILNQLLAPFYWAMVAIWILFQRREIEQFFPDPVFFMGAICLFIGTFFLVYATSIACAIRKKGKVIRITPLMPLYWIAISIAAWKGTMQLFTAPHFWEKTSHHAD